MLRSLLRYRLVHGMIFNPLTRYLVLYPAFWIGYLIFRWSGRTPWFVYVVFLLLQEQTRGRFGSRLAETIARHRPLLDFAKAEGVLGSGTELEEELTAALAALRKDGYYVFRSRLPAVICEELIRFASQHPATLRPPQPGCPPQLTFDPTAPKAPTYHFKETQLILEPPVQRLLGDTSLMALAQRYLGTVPVNDLICMWWSAPRGTASSEAAQLFHFDVDRLRFLKIFVYLTDVGSENGPHVFVRGSHRERPDLFYQARRFSDQEVVACYPAEDVVEITGPSGSIIAVDTSGLHKGKAPEAGCRLIFQMELACSLFGETWQPLQIPANAEPVLLRAQEDYPTVFERFSAASTK